MSNAVAVQPPKGALNGKGGGIKGWLLRNWCYIAAFCLPVVLIYIAYAIFGLYPFHNTNGEQYSVLCLDLNGQYVYYFEAIRDAFHGDGSILYNWSRNLSGGYQGVIGYYLASPFTLIVILLPRTMILGALQIMILCKLGAASVTFAYYLRKSKHIAPAFAMTFGTMFGMCAYAVIQTIDPMWLDGLVLLPLIALGVEYLVDDGRKLNLILPLGLMCIANFYIGFMICIFTGIYFIVYVTLLSDKSLVNKLWLNPKECRRRYGDDGNAGIWALKTAGRMVIATALAMCIAAFMILPVYNALALGKFDFTKPDYSFKAQFTILEFIAQFGVNSYNTVDVQGMPEIYSGVLAFLCLPLFFFNGRIPLNKKVGYGVLIGALVISMYVKPIDMLWHGGQMPNWLPFRYSFIFSFVVLCMAAMTMRCVGSVDKVYDYQKTADGNKAQRIIYADGVKSVFIGGTFAVIFVLEMIINAQHYTSKKGEYLDSFGSIWMTVIFLAIYSVIVYFMTRKNPSKQFTTILTAALIGVTGIELTYNAACEFKDIHKDVAYSSRRSYRQYIATGREVVDRIYAEDPSFYRAEKTYTRTVNDNAGFRLRGITHSSSVMNTQILKFIEAMGYSCRSYYSRYDGNTPLADSLLGIKYVMDKGDENKNILKAGENSDSSVAYQLKFTETALSQSETEMDVNVYENPNALSLGYMVSKDILKIRYFGNDNPFNSQNLLMSTISGNTVFTEGNGFESWHHYYYDIPITEPLRMNQCHEDAYGTQRRFREDDFNPANPTVHQADPTVDIFLEAMSEDPIYLFFKTENESKVNLWLTDQWNETADVMLNTDGTQAKSIGSYFETDNYRILNIGSYPKGQKLQIRMTLLSDGNNTKEKYTIVKDFFFCHFNTKLFQEDINILKENQWELTTYGGRTLEGKITAKEGQIMMTSVPAEPGWTVWVDGKKYTYTKKVDGKDVDYNYVTLFQSMIGVELEPGEHVIKMRYTPPGLTTGLILLVIGLAGAVLVYLYDKKHNKMIALLKENRKNGIYELPIEDDLDNPEIFGKIKSLITGKNEPVQAVKPAGDVVTYSVADEIRKLKTLLDEGALTQEEFDNLKKELLSGKKK